MQSKNFQMSNLDLEKEEEPEINLLTFAGSQRKLGNSPRNIYLCFSNYTKFLTVWSIINCGKLLKRWKCQTILPVSWEICLWVKKQQLEPYRTTDWFKIEKGVQWGCLLSPYLLNLYAEHIMTNAGPDELVTSWNQDTQQKYQQPQICGWYQPNSRKWGGTKEPLDEGERGESKSWIKTK